jgi:hypothetical protein
MFQIEVNYQLWHLLHLKIDLIVLLQKLLMQLIQGLDPKLTAIDLETDPTSSRTDLTSIEDLFWILMIQQYLLC